MCSIDNKYILKKIITNKTGYDNFKVKISRFHSNQKLMKHLHNVAVKYHTDLESPIDKADNHDIFTNGRLRSYYHDLSHMINSAIKDLGCQWIYKLMTKSHLNKIEPNKQLADKLYQECRKLPICYTTKIMSINKFKSITQSKSVKDVVRPNNFLNWQTLFETANSNQFFNKVLKSELNYRVNFIAKHYLTKKQLLIFMISNSDLDFDDPYISCNVLKALNALLHNKSDKFVNFTQISSNNYDSKIDSVITNWLPLSVFKNLKFTLNKSGSVRASYKGAKDFKFPNYRNLEKYEDKINKYEDNINKYVVKV